MLHLLERHQFEPQLLKPLVASLIKTRLILTQDLEWDTRPKYLILLRTVAWSLHYHWSLKNPTRY